MIVLAVVLCVVLVGAVAWLFWPSRPMSDEGCFFAGFCFFAVLSVAWVGFLVWAIWAIVMAATK